MEERVRVLLQARIKKSGWDLPERANFLKEIIEEKDDAPIKSLAPARRRLKKIQGQGDKENDSPTEDLNITRAEPTTVSSRKPTRVLLDESSEEAASEPHCPAVVKNPTPTLSPIATAAVASPSRDADLHRQQLLDLVNDIENMRLSGGMGMTPDVESSSASEEADEAPNAATPQAAPVVTPMITTKKLTADEPSEGSAVEVEEEPLLEAIKPADSRGEEELHDGRYVENIDSERSSVQSPSVDEEADVQAHIAAKLLQNEAFFNSPITKHASPAVDSPLIVKRTTTMRRVVLSDDEDEMLPVTPAPKLIPSKLRVVESSDTEEKEAVVNQKGVEKQEQKRDDEEEKGDEGEDEEEDDEEDDEDDDEEEEERKRPKNPFIDSEAEEASTPDEKPVVRRKSRKSDVWIVDDNANETVVSEEDEDDDEEEEPAGETLHSDDDDDDDEDDKTSKPQPKSVLKDLMHNVSEDEEEDEEEEEEEEKTVPKTPTSKKTTTSQPILRTPVNKVTPASASVLANTPGSHFQRNKVALTAQLFTEYNKRAFGGRLDPAMKIEWTKKLKTTAGRTLLKRRTGAAGVERFAEVELEVKVVDTEEKLRRTLLHELCHAAAWVIDGSSRPPHGGVFWKWAAVAKKAFPHHEVRTCHSYVINFKHHWRCTRCSRVIGRHSKSIKPTQRCECGGELLYEAPTKADGTPRRTPAKPNPYTQFVKENFAAIKAQNPGATQAQLMQKVSEQYKRTPRK